MQMTPEEIVVRFKEAAKKEQQIQILAEMNLCSNAEIIKVLKEAKAIPQDFDGRRVPRTQKKPPEDEKAVVSTDLAAKVALDRLQLEASVIEQENRKLENENKELAAMLEQMEVKNADLDRKCREALETMKELREKVTALNDTVSQLKGAIQLKTDTAFQYERFILSAISSGALDMEI